MSTSLGGGVGLVKERSSLAAKKLSKRAIDRS